MATRERAVHIVIRLAVLAAGVLVCACADRFDLDKDRYEPVLDLREEFRAFLPVPYLCGRFDFHDVTVADGPLELLCGKERRAKLVYYLSVPPGSALDWGFAVGDGAPSGRYRVSITLQKDDGKKATLAKETFWHLPGRSGRRVEGVSDLSPFQGALVKLTLSATGLTPDSKKRKETSGWSRLVVRSITRPRPLLEPSGDQGPALAPGVADDLLRLRRCARRANLIVILLDAARADRFSSYGYGRPTTLNADRLAKEGIRFDRAYCQAVYTHASVGTLMTGLYPLNHGAVNHRKLSEGIETLAGALKKSGFSTASFIANPNAGPAFGYSKGFDTIQHVNYDPVTGAKIQRVSTPDLFPPRLSPWLAEHRDERFFLYVHLLQPHLPFCAPKPIKRQFRRKGQIPLNWSRHTCDKINEGLLALEPGHLVHLNDLYDANLAYADRFIGTFTLELEALGLLDNSVLVVLSDHGEGLHEHGIVGHNVGLYEETTRVPMILHLPGSAPRFTRGLVVQEPVGIIDLAPTLLDLLQAQNGMMTQGETLLPLLAARSRGKRGDGTPPEGLSAAYVVSQDSNSRPAFAFVTRTEKIVLDSRGRFELFDLARDAQEKNPLPLEPANQSAYKVQRAVTWLGKRLQTKRMAGENPKADLDQKTTEELRSLGYLQ